MTRLAADQGAAALEGGRTTARRAARRSGAAAAPLGASWRVAAIQPQRTTTDRHRHPPANPPTPTHTHTHTHTHAGVTPEAAVATIKRGAAAPGSVPAPAMLSAMLALEKAKLDPSGWLSAIEAPRARWRLVFTADSKQVQAAAKRQPNKGGIFFPLTAAQKFDASRANFENGVFLGQVASLTFDGPYAMAGRQLSFDVHRMNLGVGPWRWSISLKKGAPDSIAAVPEAERKKLPFFLYAYADGERGRERGDFTQWGGECNSGGFARGVACGFVVCLQQVCMCFKLAPAPSTPSS